MKTRSTIFNWLCLTAASRIFLMQLVGSKWQPAMWPQCLELHGYFFEVKRPLLINSDCRTFPDVCGINSRSFCLHSIWAIYVTTALFFVGVGRSWTLTWRYRSTWSFCQESLSGKGMPHTKLLTGLMLCSSLALVNRKCYVHVRTWRVQICSI